MEQYVIEGMHGFLVLHSNGWSYPFTTANMARWFAENLALLKKYDKLKLLRRFVTVEIAYEQSYKYNEGELNRLIADAKHQQRKEDFAKLSKTFGATAFYGVANNANRTATGVKHLYMHDLPQKQTVTTEVASADPRKLMLLPYVNAELLPDPPVDGEDTSTEACWKRQARTISGLLQDLEQRTKALQQAKTEHEVTKTKLASVTDSLRTSQKEVFNQAVSSFNEGIRLKCLENSKAADNKSYREQVLKNSESVAVVKYRNGNGYRLVVDGNAYFKNWYGDTEASLLKLANNINCGKVSISCPTLALIRETYNKEDYA